MIVFACPGCRLRLQTGDGGAGRKVKCPRCARAVAVPTTAASESATLPPAAPGGAGPSPPDSTEAAQVPPAAVGAAVPPQLANHPRYRVLALLGQGGMGAVYKAEHRRMERPVALKVVNPTLVGDAAAVRRFQQEVKAAALLHHPHIVTAFDADQAGDLHFLVMEFVEGESLAAYLARTGPLPVAEACRYVRQAALALQHAHERGMVHRDVKPHNLMRTPQGLIKILDFGLARLAAAETPGQSQLTGACVLMGTADYIAPEQAGDAHAADIRADIYSLGCTLYQLLTGRVPFPSGSAFDKVLKHSADAPTPVTTLRPDLPPELAAAVERMMAKKAADRYQTPAQVAKALAPFTRAAPAAATLAPRRAPAADRTAADRPPAARTGAASRRAPWKRLVAAAALAVVVGGFAVAAAVYCLSSDQGDLVIAPESPDAEVVVSQNGRQVAIIDTRTTKRIRLPSGDYDLKLKDDPGGLKLGADRITVRRGDTAPAAVRILRILPRDDPNVLVVAADGSARFRSVRQALLEARDGMTVRIKPGTYEEEPLVVHSDVTVEGDGPPGGVVLEPSDETAPAVQSLAARAVLRSLTVRARAGHALVVEKGGATVEDCTFTRLEAAHGVGVVVVLGDASAHFLRTTVKSNPEGCGVILLGTADATLEECDVFDNGFQGLWVGEGAHAVVRKGRFHDGKQNGIFLNGKGRVEVEDCEITGNGANGVCCVGEGVAVLRRCRVNGNLWTGLSAAEGGSITAEGCDLGANVHGPTHREADGKITETPAAERK